MKNINLYLSAIFFLGISNVCYSQIQSFGYIEEVIPPEADIYKGYYPKLQIFGDTLYACSNSGIYYLIDNSEWKLYGFKNIPVIEFAKNGSELLAISTGTRSRLDKLLFISFDYGKTHSNYTSSSLLGYGWNYLHRIVQNPKNGNSVLVAQARYGLSKSTDYGKSWSSLMGSLSLGADVVFAGFHPADTTTVFYTGETGGHAGGIYKITDDGENWSFNEVPGGDNSVYHIAFHPVNPDILIHGAFGTMGKSTDRGETWTYTNLKETGRAFYKVLFDEENPAVLYAFATRAVDENLICVYRSTDTGNSWNLFHKEILDKDCGEVIDMVKYKNKLIFYTRKSGFFYLKLYSSDGVNNIESKNDCLRVYPTMASSFVTVESDCSPINNIQIFDVSGIFIQEFSFVGDKTEINTSSLPAGIYYLSIRSGNQFYIKKIIKIYS